MLKPALRTRLFSFLAILLLSDLCSGLGKAEAKTVMDPGFRFECPKGPIGCSGLFNVHEGDQSELDVIPNGDASLSLRLKYLKGARKSIRIQALILTGDESGIRVSEILKKKRLEEKVDVKIIVDAFSNPSPQTQSLYFDLKQNDIEVEGYEAANLQWINEISLKEPLLPNKRFHEKMWIIDGDEPDGIAITGGLNVANEYFRTGPSHSLRWRDQDVIVRGPIVQDVVTAFDRNYAFFKKIKSDHPKIFNTDSYWKVWNCGIRSLFGSVFSCCADENGRPEPVFNQDPEIVKSVQRIEDREYPVDFQPAKLRFFQHRPREGETYIHQVILNLIRTAQEEILIGNAYFFPSQEIIEAMADATKKRGVRTVLLTNSKETNDVPFMSAGSRYMYLDLMNAGNLMKIFEWQGSEYQEGTLHAKYAVFDRKIGLVSSYNLDRRSQDLNSESAMVFESPQLAQKLADLFWKNDVPRSRRITIEEAKKFHNLKRVDRLVDVMLSNEFKGQL